MSKTILPETDARQAGRTAKTLEREVLGVPTSYAYKDANGVIQLRVGARKEAPSVNPWGIELVQETWHSATFQNSWTQYGGWATVQYRKLPSGFVLLKGLALSPNPMTAGVPMFTLPAGYRPAENHLFHVGAFDNVPARVDIYTDGTVVPQTVVNGTYWSVSDLHGFYAES